MTPATPQTIDEVLVELDLIIHQARETRDRLGYFAVLYRNVTIKVKEGIAAGLFEDGARMEKLDVTFANRYLTALDSFRRSQPLSRCWLVCFQLAGKWRPIILQQLLAGMNAHINFDLGIAAQAVAPGAELESLRNDFNVINGVLGGMIVKFRGYVVEVSPQIKFLDRIDPSAADAVVKSCLGKARTNAWLVPHRIQ